MVYMEGYMFYMEGLISHDVNRAILGVTFWVAYISGLIGRDVKMVPIVHRYSLVIFLA